MPIYNKNKIRGATMVEYVLIAGIIAVGTAALLTPLGTKVNGVFSGLTSNLP